MMLIRPNLTNETQGPPGVARLFEMRAAADLRKRALSVADGGDPLKFPFW